MKPHDHPDHPLRLTKHLQPADSGNGCIMQVQAWENGHNLTDTPANVDPFIARSCQIINDTLCRHTKTVEICPTCTQALIQLKNLAADTKTERSQKLVDAQTEEATQFIRRELRWRLNLAVAAQIVGIIVGVAPLFTGQILLSAVSLLWLILTNFFWHRYGSMRKIVRSVRFYKNELQAGTALQILIWFTHRKSRIDYLTYFIVKYYPKVQAGSVRSNDHQLTTEETNEFQKIIRHLDFDDWDAEFDTNPSAS